MPVCPLSFTEITRIEADGLRRFYLLGGLLQQRMLFGIELWGFRLGRLGEGSLELSEFSIEVGENFIILSNGS